MIKSPFQIPYQCGVTLLNPGTLGKSYSHMIVGGYSEAGYEKRVWIHENHQNFKELPSLIQARANFAIVVHQNRIIVAGGKIAKTALDVCEMYDPEENEWREIGKL